MRCCCCDASFYSPIWAASLDSTPFARPHFGTERNRSRRTFFRIRAAASAVTCILPVNRMFLFWFSLYVFFATTAAAAAAFAFLLPHFRRQLSLCVCVCAGVWVRVCVCPCNLHVACVENCARLFPLGNSYKWSLLYLWLLHLISLAMHTHTHKALMLSIAALDILLS